MRLLLFFIVLPLAVTAQPQIKNSSDSNPVYYIDSVRVTSIQLFDHEKIESVNVVKEKDSLAPNGKVFISIKKSASLQWVTINDIISKKQLTDSAACIFMLNDNIIKDTVAFRIDKDLIIGIDILKADELENLPSNIPNLELLKLFTGSKESMAKQKIVRIRSRQIN